MQDNKIPTDPNGLDLVFDVMVDARHMNCPLPILKAKKVLMGMQSGQILKVIATDTGSLRDFQSFTKQTGHTLLEQHTIETDNTKPQFVHFLQKR